MILLRSILFNIAFYAAIIIEMIVFTPFYFLVSRKRAWFVPKFWSKANHWLMEKIVGTTYEIEGAHHIKHEACIIAPKHQSFWDTYAFLPYIPEPIYILKRELMWIPLFGWYLAKMKMIPVHRGSRWLGGVEVDHPRCAACHSRKAPDHDLPGRHAPRARRCCRNTNSALPICMPSSICP